MDFRQLHFAQGSWLWGLLAIPVMLLLYALFFRAKGAELLERFADRHLLPHLVKKQRTVRTFRRPLLVWAIAWLCGIVAMAGPRWDYTDEQAFQAPRDLVIVLDLSESMNATDVKPSRIARAREEIEDLLDMSQGTSIGLVAYAAVPHMVTPLTDDVRTIRNLLPALDTSLVTIQGDRLKPALQMAAGMLKAEPGDSKSILVISDGAFEENDFAGLARAAGNATVFTMGIGAAGVPAPGGTADPLQGGDGETSASPLEADRLQTLAAAGHGLYVEANYTDSDTRAILGRIESGSGKAQATAKSIRVWEEHFYVPALLLALLLLPLFRKGASFFLIVLFATTIFTTGQVHAAVAADLFLNKQQQARAAFDKGNYKDAMAKFDTPYQRGVAAYRAGAYDKAAILFKVAAQKNNLDALYNLGNAQLLQGQVNDAIADYEAVLKQRPGDAGARHNLDIALKMLAQNKEQSPQKKPPQDKQGQGGGQGNQQAQQPPQQGKNGQQANQSGENRGQNKQQPQAPQQQGKNGQQANRGGSNPNQPQAGQPQAGQPTPSPQAKPQQAQTQSANSQQAREQSAQQRAGKGRQDSQPQNTRTAATAPLRTQRDVDADEWLARVQSDPGSFLKNQFMIEEQESAQQGAPQ